MGVLIIQRGFLKYCNKRFTQIFGYTEDDISKWKRREFYKIIHPEDSKNITRNSSIEGNNTAIFRFRGITKDNKVISIENYVSRIKYNDKWAYLSSYISKEEFPDDKDTPKIIKTNEGKKIVLDYDINIVKTLEDNNIKFETISHASYREED
jgi:PAS domain S-box-containing protein